MPDPKDYDNREDFMRDCIPIRIKEGDDQKRAVAICSSMWKRRNQGVDNTEKIESCVGEVLKRNPDLKEEHAYKICSTLHNDKRLSKKESNKQFLNICLDSFKEGKFSDVYEVTAVVSNTLLLHDNGTGVFIPDSELEKAVETLNGALFNYDHKEEKIIGTVFNAHKEDNKAKAYVRVFDKLAREHIKTKLKSGEVPNVSVGLWGETYSTVNLGDKTIDIMYDVEFVHLSLVEKGACSEKEGCGIGLSENLAKWDRKFINDLPDAAFAYIEPGGEKDEEGKTVPRSLRHFPHHNSSVKRGSEHNSVDIPHLRNALARLPQSKISNEAKAKARAHLIKHAKALGVGDYESFELGGVKEMELEEMNKKLEELTNKLAQFEEKEKIEKEEKEKTEILKKIEEKDKEIEELKKKIEELSKPKELKSKLEDGEKKTLNREKKLEMAIIDKILENGGIHL